MKRILGVLLAGVLLLSGCGQWQKSQKESAYHLYCLDKTGTTLVQEPYEPKEGTDQKLIKELVDALQEKPAKDGNQALLSNGISIKTYTLENGLLTLNLSGEYGELARPQEVLVRAGLVRTFVQVPEVERVTLLIDGDPLKDSKGREIGTMTADSFLENSGREIYQYQYAPLRRPDGHTDRPLFLMADQPESGLMDQFVYIHFLPHYPNQIAGFEHRIGIRIS